MTQEESVFSKIQERLDNVKNAKLDIAVTGETGTGKSSFINAIRGLDDEDGAAATTGVVDTTMKPTKYPYPNHPNVNLWDLPGIGAQNFKADEYLQQVNFSRYDFFIIITSERCRENPAKLACEIQKMGKKFYFVCSKVDADIDASRKRRKKNFNDEKILEEIRQNCIDYLKKEGVESPRVYLLSSFELHKFDFQDLVETFKIELPRYKRHVFLQALPNISVEILEKKINSLKKMVWLFSFASCAASFIPGAEISSACDIAILILALNIFRHALGLDNESLEKLARRLNKSPSELKSVMKFEMSGEIKKHGVLKLLSKAAEEQAKSRVKKIPIISLIVQGGISLFTTYLMLDSSLKVLEEDAKNMLKACEQNL
ncbi:interferon-inducible GTPase 5-like [Latimeria chalumnae]|uniref:interferon-inducible GTPase 5-like n=1 Tax=Latimeria chalumnae TaxID=7897 RepID=UPI0003C1AF69|nr:PREDICTED: interferon-inducible GTPase 5-like [Latimeria chalumnae]|eukprot:XP_005995763.1 PREDICTED: interferon-inducible GTPase 5-like [Latimeria chalumnae]